MIAGAEGIHEFYPPGAGSPAFTLGRVKDDAGVPVFPRAKIRQWTGGSLGDPEDIADPIVGAFGEVPRPSSRKGKTVTYTGALEALSLADYYELADAIRTGMADLTTPGVMVVSWHPLARPRIGAISTPKSFPARALGLEIPDPIESANRFVGTYVAAFRNHDGRHFDLTGTSVARDIPSTGISYAWPSVVFPATMRGPVLDVVTNSCTNPDGEGGTTGWAAAGANVTTFDTVDLLTSLVFEPIFDPPTDTALHVITNGSASAQHGAEFTKSVVSGSAVRFVAWVRNRTSSAQPIRLFIYNAGGTLKATSTSEAPANATWTRVEVTVTPDSTGAWKFRVGQNGSGACEWAFASVRICPAIAMTIDVGFGPRLNLPATWDAPDLHLDFERLSILDDAGHDYSALISTAVGTWKRNPWGAGSVAANAAAVITGPAIDPDIGLTLSWTPAYW